jgi:predicted ATPase
MTTCFARQNLEKINDMQAALKGRIIAFTGTHGTGKTTAVYDLAANLCKDRPGKRIGIVAENASLCPFPYNKEATPAAQQWIFATHISRELSALQHYDIVVADRSCVDPIAYTWAMGYHAQALAMQAVARWHLVYYEKIIFRKAAGNPWWINAPHRETGDAAFRAAVEQELISIYNRLNAQGLIEYA